MTAVAGDAIGGVVRRIRTTVMHVTRGLTVRAHAVSASARQKIEAAGGRVEIIA